VTEPQSLLDDLFDAERRAAGPSSAQQARVRAAIAATVAATAVTGASVATAGSVAPTAGATAGFAGLGTGAVVVAALAATVGGGIVVSRYEPGPAVVDVVTVVAPAPPPGLVVPAEAAALPASTPPSAPAAHLKPAPRVAATVVVADAASDALVVAAEREHLGRVRAAMNAGELETALQLLQVHVVSWPRGKLVEEREALTVVCVARLGRVDQARDLARAFVNRCPQSLFRDAIEQAAH
jgi:hypothetical protein